MSEKEELRKKVEMLEKRLAQLESESDTEKRNQRMKENDSRRMSRRGFMKTAAMGAAGLGMMSAASGLSITSNSPVEFFKDSNSGSPDGDIYAGSVFADNVGGSGGGNVAVPSEPTVKGIADAIENNSVVRLLPGVNYTNDGSTTIFHQGSHGNFGNDTYVFAHGAQIEVNGKLIEWRLSHDKGDQLHWYGGKFHGNGNAGDIAFMLPNAGFNEINPQRIANCEAAIYMLNEGNWCEFNMIDFYGKDNMYDLVCVGGGEGKNGYDKIGSPPPNSSLRAPDKSEGNANNKYTPSFRGLRLRMLSNSKRIGFYNDQANVYDSRLDLSFNGSSGFTGWRMGGNYKATTVNVWYETPGGSSGGTAIKVHQLRQDPRFEYMALHGADTPIENNTGLPLEWEGNPHGGSGSNFSPEWRSGGNFGVTRFHNTDIVEEYQWRSGNPTKVFHRPVEAKQGVQNASMDLTERESESRRHIMFHNGDKGPEEQMMRGDGKGGWKSIEGNNDSIDVKTIRSV